MGLERWNEKKNKNFITDIYIYGYSAFEYALIYEDDEVIKMFVTKIENGEIPLRDIPDKIKLLYKY